MNAFPLPVKKERPWSFAGPFSEGGDKKPKKRYNLGDRKGERGGKRFFYWEKKFGENDSAPLLRGADA